MTPTTPAPEGAGKRKRLRRLVDGVYRTKVPHPTRHGKSVRLTARSVEALAVSVGWWKRLRDDVKHGLQTEERALELIAERRGVSELVTVVDVVRAYADSKRESESGRQLRSALRSRIEPWFEFALLGRVDASTMLRFVDKLRERGFEESTIANDVKRMRAAVRWAVAAYKVAPSKARRFLEYVHRPTENLAQPRPSVATLPELLWLVQAAAKADREAIKRGVRGADLMDRVLFLAFTMLRKSEATALRWSDLETNGEVLRVWRQGGEETTERKSGGAAYRLRLHPIAIAVLARQELRLRLRGGAVGPDDPIWPRPQGGFRKGGEIIAEGIVKRLAVEATLPHAARWSTHCLRHTGAAMEAFYARGLGGLKHRGGWRSERMAGHYASAALPPSAIPGPAGDDSDRDRDAHGAVFASAVNMLATEIALADEYLRERSPSALRAQKKQSRDGIRARLQAMGTWAELARDAVGDVDLGRVPSEHAREASARISRVAHAAFVRAKREGLALEDCQRVRNTAEKKQRDEWNRALGNVRKRLLLNPTPNKET